VSSSRMRSRRRWACGLALASLLAAPSAGATDDGSAHPIVDLDQLLKVPSSLDLEPETRGGATRAEWRSRFEAARADLARARDELSRSQAKLAELAGESSAWKMSAPGLGGLDTAAGDAPLDYGLKNELRRNREEVARSERRMTELEVEANLAGVPENWRGAPAEEAPVDSWESTQESPAEDASEAAPEAE